MKMNMEQCESLKCLNVIANQIEYSDSDSIFYWFERKEHLFLFLCIQNLILILNFPLKHSQ